MSFAEQIMNPFIDQITKIASIESNQTKLRECIIDPLVYYFKDRIKMFYFIIAILLVLIIITNFCILFYLFKVLSIINIPLIK